MAEPLVAATIVRRVVDDLVALGADRDALLAEASLPPSALSFHRLRLPWSAIEALFEAAERLTGNTRVGFERARRYDPSMPTLPELVLYVCGTLREGMRRAQGLSRIWGDAERWALDGDHVRYWVTTPSRRAHAHLAEHGLALPVRAVEAVAGIRLVAVEVSFAHPRDEDPRDYEAWFGCPVRFGAGVNELLARPDQLDAPLRSANPLFARFFQLQAETEISAFPPATTSTDRLRATLRDALDHGTLGECTLESAAAALRTSPRTLQRELSAEGTSFVAELDAIRRGTAERLLAAGVDIAEVSWRLGYAEPSVFHRAFKRWTGATPDQYRRSP